MKPRKIPEFRPQGDGHCSSLLPAPDDTLLFHSEGFPYPGAAIMECLRLRSKAWLGTLTLFFAVWLCASFFTSLSLSFFNCKLGIITVLIS